MGAFREICSLGTRAGRCTLATAPISLCEPGLSHHLAKIYALSIRLVSSQQMMVLKYGLTLEDMVCEGPTRAIHICGYSRWQCNFRQQTSGTSGSTRLWESWSQNLMSRLRVRSGELLSQRLRERHRQLRQGERHEYDTTTILDEWGRKCSCLNWDRK